MKGYNAKRDMCELWTQFFDSEGVSRKDIEGLELFDPVFDLYKCDPNYLRWDCSMRRQWVDIDSAKNAYHICGVQEYQSKEHGQHWLKNASELVQNKVAWTIKKWETIRVNTENGDETVERTVFTLQNEKGNCLGVTAWDDKSKEKDARDRMPVIICCMEKEKKIVGKDEVLPAQFAWTFERYYDELCPDTDTGATAVCIRNVQTGRYLTDLFYTTNR